MADYGRISWEPLPDSLSLETGSIHVWRASLCMSDAKLLDLSRALSAEELERAGRFHFDVDRRRYTTARGLLRKILSIYLNAEPGSIKFSYTRRGKPELDPIHRAESIHFSLSHSHELALFAFTRNHQIGIDVEHVRPMSDMDGLARRYFSDAEYQGIRHFSGVQKEERFFSVWTEKEAYLKATGEGLAGLEMAVENSEYMNMWEIKSFIPADEYVAAVAFMKGYASDRLFIDADRV